MAGCCSHIHPHDRCTAPSCAAVLEVLSFFLGPLHRLAREVEGVLEQLSPKCGRHDGAEHCGDVSQVSFTSDELRDTDFSRLYRDVDHALVILTELRISNLFLTRTENLDIAKERSSDRQV